MITLGYGFKKPQAGDNGSTFFPALEGDIQQLNDHSHNGSDSVKLTTGSIQVVTQSILSGSWSLVSGGLYRQSVSLPGGLQYDQIAITFKDSASGNLLYLTVEKIDATTYYVYINDNSLNLTAVYGI